MSFFLPADAYRTIRYQPIIDGVMVRAAQTARFLHAGHDQHGHLAVWYEDDRDEPLGAWTPPPRVEWGIRVLATLDLVDSSAAGHHVGSLRHDGEMVHVYAYVL